VNPDWTFLSNHGHVLIALGREPDARIRDVAEVVGITERAVQNILADLCAAGYVAKERLGRRNHYELRPEVPMRHPLEQGHAIGELLAAIGDVVATPAATPDAATEPR